MCIKSVFESIDSIRHNNIVRKAIPHVYDTITLKIWYSSELRSQIISPKILPYIVSTPLYE